MKHKHLPSFWGFLFSRPSMRKGPGFRAYYCKKCGKRILLISSQRKIYNWLAAVPAILVIPFWLLPNPHHSILIGFAYGGMYLILGIVIFYLAYRFAKFKTV